jgi:hypothetical protein
VQVQRGLCCQFWTSHGNHSVGRVDSIMSLTIAPLTREGNAPQLTSATAVSQGWDDRKDLDERSALCWLCTVRSCDAWKPER